MLRNSSTEDERHAGRVGGEDPAPLGIIEKIDKTLDAETGIYPSRRIDRRSRPPRGPFSTAQSGLRRGREGAPPDAGGIRWSRGSGKLVLKAAMHDLLPEHVLTHRKQGFGAPVWRWATRFRGLVEQELVRDELADYLDMDEVRTWLDAPESRRQGFAVWILLNFALWHRHWIEGSDLRELPVLEAARAH
jgi:asparagine synthetase B (glutamine-hydrolysing)